MSWVVDLVYLLAAAVSSPFWLWRLARSGKYRTDWPGRLGRVTAQRASDRPRLLIHAVSVGEVNAIRLLVDQIAGEPAAVEVVVSTTTDTGVARARELFAPAHQVVRYPLDFSFAVRRFLGTVRPDAVALVELEVWPNFTRACASRGIPVCVVNGRLSARSHQRYRLLRSLVRPSFRRLTAALVQNETYAGRFIDLGMAAESVRVTGTMKWDTAQIADSIDGAEGLASSLGIDRGRPLVVAGSTGPGEPEMLVEVLPPDVQLLCAPRKPEWFDAAARAMPGCARRSRGDQGSATGRFLLDTIGELRLAYALADLVVVGRSFGQLHGSDMMEPVALGKAVVVGPAVDDFQETVQALLAGDGIIQTDSDHLAEVLADLLKNASRREELGRNGRCVIRAHQGATKQTAEFLGALLTGSDRRSP